MRFQQQQKIAHYNFLYILCLENFLTMSIDYFILTQFFIQANIHYLVIFLNSDNIIKIN